MTLGALALGLLATGCDEDSANVATADIRVQSEINIDDEGGTMDVILYERETTGRIVLSDGDALKAAVDEEEPVSLEPSDVVDSVYERDIPTNAGSVTLSLIRPNDTSADITVAIPEEAELDGATSFSRADDDITITWSNAADDGFVSIFVDSCADIEIETTSTKEAVADEGSYTLTMSEVLAEAGDDADCAQLVIVRSRLAADVGPLFSQSQLVGRRYQRNEITLTP